MTSDDHRPDGSPPGSATEAIESRRTARAFDPARPLPSPLLARLLSLGTLAPSPGHLQPWRFVVVQSLPNRRRLRRCAFGEARLTDAPAALIVLGYLNPDETDLEAALAFLGEAGPIGPEGLARLRATIPREWRRGDDRTLRATRPAMLAAATLMIAAESLGVASAWLDSFDEEATRRAFGIPDDHAVCGILALGYALGPPPPAPGRFPLDRVCFGEHFGAPWAPLEGGDPPG